MMSAGAVAKLGMAHEHGPQEQREDEHHGRGESGQARAAALGHAGGAFHIAGDGGGAQAGARHGADGVGHQSAAHAGQLAVLIQHVALCGNADERAHGVEQVNEQEREHDNCKFNGVVQP